ncbi:hypothetical protein M011DRAFT_24957 [Sporormia fimetaria CBS 119925]|uniref:Uncharacterized protein n=1 Tax=Sporormia fimetaria CBS 119925 TaxID=1340428 RepID=A0A6A6VBI5_9PLEO|nr:hypothetical protein M011DRAFT_24957 [Sporormia fimetaria CBS 119925]
MAFWELYTNARISVARSCVQVTPFPSWFVQVRVGRCVCCSFFSSVWRRLPCSLGRPLSLAPSPHHAYRTRYAQLRAQWEQADSITMGGRKDKAGSNQTSNADTNVEAGNRLRKKLSYGLSLLSNPLSQRLNSHRQEAGPQPSNSESTAFHYGVNTKPGELRGLLSSEPATTSSSINTSPLRACSPSSSTMGYLNPHPTSDLDATPRAPLPRSHTMSYIPLPARSNSQASASEAASTLSVRPPSFTIDARRTPSKIPTPSPPPNGSRMPSPRQYRHEKHIAAGAAFATNPTPSTAAALAPPNVSVRSYTTPNLQNAAGPGSSAFAVPKRSSIRGKHRHASPAPFRGPQLKENTPTTPNRHRWSQRSTANTDSRSSQSTINNRNPPGPDHRLGHNKPLIATGPSTAPVRFGTHPATQTPTTAKRITVEKGSSKTSSVLGQDPNATPIVQPRLMGPLNAPTPTPPKPTGLRPRGATIQNGQRRRSSRSLTGLKDAPVPGKPAGGIQNEARTPRSSTFHHMPRYHETPPPVPAVPEVYRTPAKRKTSGSRENRLVCQNGSPVAKGAHFKPTLPSTVESETDDVRVWRNASPSGEKAAPDISEEVAPITLASKCSRSLKRPRSCSTTALESLYANAETRFQVKDSMPAAWWAGRFQTRYDQWRTEAMTSELDPTYRRLGTLGGCKLSQERAAACYVLLGLRELCVTNKAMDSLWVFEYKYRRDHGLLDSMPEYPTRSSSKGAVTATPRQGGPFGRAVRKLTPRKSSLVNLLMGKGWNKAEES